MLKVLPVPLLTAGHCSHQDVGVQMVEENRAEWGRMGQNGAYRTREGEKLERGVEAGGCQQTSVNAGSASQHITMRVFSEEQSDTFLTNSWYINLQPPKLRKDT